ncbi:MAG TPA: Gldg family protein [Polyangia bacterium]|nr:Gldg family protein [Polyangia bacterium]
MNAPSYVWTVIYFGGMLLAFIGERIVGAGTARALTGVGVVCLGAAIAMRAARAKKAASDRQLAERMLIALYAVGAFAVALYLAQSDLSSTVLGKPLERDWPKLSTVLATLWPVVWIFSALPILLCEFSYATVARSPRLEIARIRDAVWSGVGLAGAVVFAFALCYVGAERDKKVDLSYFRTAKPGESTRKIVQTMDQPIQVSLFFPPSNEVREEVAGYFDDLKKESKLLEVQSYDRDVDPAKAKELGVTGNGIVVVARGGHREQMSIGLELDGARSQLRNLDRDVQTRLLKVARPARNVYFVTGHGERTFDPVGDTDKRGTVRELREAMQQQGFTVRQLGPAEGLAQDVPQDASLVIMIGPTKPLQPEEDAALMRYFDRGGRIFVALDPESGDEHELLGPLGVKYVPTTLCGDVNIARKTNQITDRQNIVAMTFSSHPSVTTLGRYGGRAPLILIGAGHFEEQKDKPKDHVVDVTVHAQPTTWSDLNGNFQFDPPVEQRKAYELAMAITKKGKDKDKKDEGRVVLAGDSDFVSDGVINLYGNPAFVLDGVKWLVGDEGITGEVSNENDVPIVHTKKQDQVWFYGSSFFAPALVLGIGFFVNGRRRGRAVRKEKQS